MKYEEKFELDFMRRTLQLVKMYEGPHDATLLLNCLLGLLIVPRETSLDKIPQDPIEELKNWGVSPTSIIHRGEFSNRKKRDDLDTLRGVVRNLRNSVAHFKFKPLDEADVVVGFEFTAQNGFKARIELGEMRVFVEKLARHLETA